MFLIPLDRKPDWRRPPLVTLGLILANVLVFLLIQASEQARLEQALDYYADSGLMELERTAWLAERDRGGVEDALEPEAGPGHVYFGLRNEPDFMARLGTGEVLPSDEDHERWTRLRAEMDRHMERVVFWRWGIQPADFDLATLVTHMFLHGGADHLIGNMVFLLLVGFLVELTIGGPLLLAIYLLGGILAGAADLVVAGDRILPGIGASAAIAAMMGLYSVLFGRQQVRFFYSVGVWFDYARAPAILLLPIWLGYEVFAWLVFTDSNIDYAAHAVGLAVGAVGGLAIQHLLPRSIDREFLTAPEREAAEEAERDEVGRLMRELDFDAARPLLEKLLEDEPRNPELLRSLHLCTRARPSSEHYHGTANRILQLPGHDADTDRLLLDVYRDYRARARPRPRLNGRMIQTLALRFCRQGALVEAEELAALMLKHRQRFPAMAAVLLGLGTALADRGHPQRAQPFLERLLALYPGGSEAEAARGLLRRLHGGAV